MSADTANQVSSTAIPTATAPAIERGRFERAVCDHMSVERVADRLYRVANGDGVAYDVDLESGACTCPDWQYRGSEYVCKHAIHASLVETYANTVSTALVARVVGHARAHGCPHARDALCDGPVGPRLPCPGCLDAVRSDGVDEWTVWTRAVTESRV